MNERLTFTVGSAFDFGLTAQQAANAAVQFLPNVTAEYKLTENGRVVLTFFYRDSYNYLICRQSYDEQFRHQYFLPP